jgi:hypothetical protein
MVPSAARAGRHRTSKCMPHITTGLIMTCLSSHRAQCRFDEHEALCGYVAVTHVRTLPHTHPLTHIHTPTHTFCFFTLSRVPDTYMQGTHWCSHWGHSARNLNIEVAVLLCTSRLAAQEKLSHSSAYIQRALERRGGRPSRRPHVQRALQFHPSRNSLP